MILCMQDRLQQVLHVGDRGVGVAKFSRCGFGKGRGCIDMAFVARQLIEMSSERDSQLSMLFIDLKKAYDSIPCVALWLVLERFGVPPVMLGLIRSLHVGSRTSSWR